MDSEMGVYEPAHSTSQTLALASGRGGEVNMSMGLAGTELWLHTRVFFLVSLKHKKSKCTCNCSCVHVPLASQSQMFLLLSALHKHFSLYAVLNLIKKNVQFAALCPVLPGLHGASEVG